MVEPRVDATNISDTVTFWKDIKSLFLNPIYCCIVSSVLYFVVTGIQMRITDYMIEVGLQRETETERKGEIKREIENAYIHTYLQTYKRTCMHTANKLTTQQLTVRLTN